ncbi:hypothetical protein UFOVP306_24 [uncultured Caudovirales phage]|uniref:Uncharacterized protein n=1 Tax=uncultured Caudovirales phage TaxID=2100421 RepID=A0A6J5LXR9_9CAUD|nr:hypothetical protein UFOVP306_24 [uncultured Caudovirales phage]
MAIATKLGKGYEDIRAQARFKTIAIQCNDVNFDLKVRIPVKREMEALIASITEPDEAKVETIYLQLSAPLRKTLEEADKDFLEALNKDQEKIKVTDNDLIVDGTSVRHVAKMTAISQLQVEKYFSLLQSATGEPITESYEEIAEEFPEAVIKEIISKIDEAIKPNYKESKKN